MRTSNFARTTTGGPLKKRGRPPRGIGRGWKQTFRVRIRRRSKISRGRFYDRQRETGSPPIALG